MASMLDECKLIVGKALAAFYAIKDELTAHFAETYDDVYKVAFGNDELLDQLAKEEAARRAEKAAEAKASGATA